LTNTTVSTDAMVAKDEYTAARSDLTALESYIDGIRAQMEAMRADTTRTASFKQQKLTEMRETIAERVHADRGKIAARLERAERRAALALVGDQDDPVVETRKARAAGRVSRLLDSGQHILEAAQLFADVGDLDALRTLRDELPSYVAANSSEHADRKQLIHDMSISFDKVMRPLLSERDQFAVDVRVGVAATAGWLDQVLAYASQADRPGSGVGLALAKNMAGVGNDQP
jgi:hypothetical protein